MIAFNVRQNYVVAKCSSSGEEKLLRDYLTLQQTIFVRRSFGRPKRIETKVVFYGSLSKKFPYGLWPNVKKHLKASGVCFVSTIHRSHLPELKSRSIGSIELRDYQLESVNKWLASGGSGIVWGAAGFGKTEIAAACIKHLLKTGIANKVLFIVNGLDLLSQAEQRLRSRLGLRIGMVSGSGVDTKRVITVAAIQKLDNLIKKKDPSILEFLSSVDLLVHDENHHARSAQSSRLVKVCPARYRLGLSARPLRNSYPIYKQLDLQLLSVDDARVLSAIGPIVSRVTSSNLIEINQLARPTIYLYPIGYEGWKSPYSSAESLSWQDARKRIIIRNSIIHDVSRKQSVEAAKAGETTLVIAGGSKELGLRVYQRLKDANLNAVYLHGGVDKNFRAKSRIGMSMNRLEACVATTIYDEGIDIPNLRQLILAYGGLSPIKNEQRLGRALRNKSGANEAVVVDFMHYNNKHLRKHSYERLKMYLEEGQYEVYMVGYDHPPYVKKLVGKDRVRLLPTAKDFKELQHGKNSGRDIEESDRNVRKGVQGMVAKETR